VQDKQITNSNDISRILSLSSTGRIIALDLGTKKIGVAVCDELQRTVRPLMVIKRRSWKELLKNVILLIEDFDAIALVLGLPLNLDESENEMTADARRLQRNFSLSLAIPVFLQDERLTTKSAQQDLHDRGFAIKEILERIDAEAAALILADFLSYRNDLGKRQFPGS
jgi:putative holliday junction resolvase